PGFCSTGATAKRTWARPSDGSMSLVVIVIFWERELTFVPEPLRFTTATLFPYFGQRSEAPRPRLSSGSLSGPFGAYRVTVSSEPPLPRLRWARVVAG